jgi:hypothetical protein
MLRYLPWPREEKSEEKKMSEPSDTPKKRKDPADLFTKGKEFFDMYSRVEEFTQEVMEENAKLQARINELVTERERVLSDGVNTPEEEELVRKLNLIKKEKQDILNRYHTVEEENKDFEQRYRDIEMENNNLANLYVASYQLHSTLDLTEVLEIITEIIINLIGAQTFGIMMLNEKRGELEPIKAEGMPLEGLPAVKVGEGIIGGVAGGGETYYRESYDRDAPLDVSHPLVCVALTINDEVIGVIVVYQLLSQKEKLVKIDYDLFGLLAAHAATAIFSSKLYGDSVRKQETIKGFIDLLTH